MNIKNIMQNAHEMTRNLIKTATEKVSYHATFALCLQEAWKEEKRKGMTAKEELLSMGDDELNMFLCNMVRHARKIDMAECDKDGEHKRSVMFWVKSNDDVQTVANEAYLILIESLLDKESMQEKPLKMVATIAALRAADRIYSQERKKGNALSLDDENDQIIIDQLATRAEKIAPSPEIGATIRDAIASAAHDSRDMDIMMLRAYGYNQADIARLIGIKQANVCKRLARILERYNADKAAKNEYESVPVIESRLAYTPDSMPESVIAWRDTLTETERAERAETAQLARDIESIRSAWNFKCKYLTESMKAAFQSHGIKPRKTLSHYGTKTA